MCYSYTCNATQRKGERGSISNKGSRENEEYTWINLSAREALSYKTKISTKDSRDKPEDSLKRTKRIFDCLTEDMQCSFPLQKYFISYKMWLTFRVEKEHCVQMWKKWQISWWQGEKQGSAEKVTTSFRQMYRRALALCSIRTQTAWVTHVRFDWTTALNLFNPSLPTVQVSNAGFKGISAATASIFFKTESHQCSFYRPTQPSGHPFFWQHMQQ